jgi:hypothetical protein
MIQKQDKITSADIQRIVAELHQALKRIYLYLCSTDDHSIIPLITTLSVTGFSDLLYIVQVLQDLFQLLGCLFQLTQFFTCPSENTRTSFELVSNQGKNCIDSATVHTRIACACLSHLTSPMPRTVFQ